MISIVPRAPSAIASDPSRCGVVTVEPITINAACASFEDELRDDHG